MKIQVLKENLAKAMHMASKFASTKAQLPVLGYLAIEANAEGIFVTATSLDVGIRLRMAGKMLEPGGTVVPAKIMGELVASLPLGSVELTGGDGENLMITAQRTRAKLQSMKLEEFPMFPGEPTLAGDWPVKGLLAAYERIGFAVSADESRPTLTGFLWHGEKGMAAATDGYRLSLSTEEVWSVRDESLKKLVVPGKAMLQLLQVFDEYGSESVKYGFSDKSQELMLIGADVRGVVRVLAGEFPKFEAIVPSGSDIEFQVNREQILTAVRSVAIFARDSANIMKFVIDEGKVELSANAAQVGENTVEVEAETLKPGKGMIAFNSKYLVDFLTHASSDRVGFGMTDSLKPGLFYEVGVDYYKHVIMPVRVKT